MNRRTLLKSSSAIFAAGLSGCSMIPGMGGGGGSAITGGEPQGRGYVISLSDGADVDVLQLMNPNDEKVVSEQIEDGQSKVKFVLAKTGNTSMGRGVTAAYRIGEYTVQAVQNDEVVQEFPVTFEPELAVTSIQFVSHIDNAPSLSNPLDEFATFGIQFKNTGNAPAIVDDASIDGSRIPNPLSSSEERDYSGSNVPYGAAMYRLQEQSGIPRQSIAIPAGKSTWYRMATHQAAVPISGIQFQSQSDTSDVEMVRPQYANTSAVRQDYVQPSIQADCSFTSGSGDVGTDITFKLSGRVDTATDQGTNFYFFRDQEVTGVGDGRRGLG